jgi:hypothetical protein
VRQVAKRRGISERTVWSDIARGRLSVIRLPNGEVRVPALALRCYRAAPRGLMPLAQVSSLLRGRRSVRSLKRDIAVGRLPIVRVSPRRLFVRKSVLRRVYKDLLPDRPFSNRDREELPDLVWLTIPQVAQLARRSVRQVYHDIHKGALQAMRLDRGTLRVWLSVAQNYAHA